MLEHVVVRGSSDGEEGDEVAVASQDALAVAVDLDGLDGVARGEVPT